MKTSDTCQWDTPNYFPHLNKQEVHVWFINIESESVDIANLFTLLSVDEQAKAERFRFAKDKRSYVVTRGILRKILGSYLTSKPESLQFSYNPHGKPILQNVPLQFNLSHSKEVALIAVTLEYSIGVDIEYLDNRCEIEGLAERFFSAKESKLLKRLAGDIKLQAFFNAWARKEAVLKALGTGLSYPLEKIEVSIMPNEPAAILAMDDNPQAKSEWVLEEIKPINNYAAAVAIKGKITKIQTWCWDFFI